MEDRDLPRLADDFVPESGRPVSMERAERQVSWFDFAREYAGMKWPHLAPNSRRNTARALTVGTLAMVTGDRGRPAEEDLRKALTAWAFNRGSEGRKPSADIARALTWLGRNTREVGDLVQPAVARSVLDALTRRADGRTAAAATVQRQRGVLVNLAEYAVEPGLLVKNPLTAIAWKAPRTVKGVDRRVVVNPNQARTLLAAVRQQAPSGPSLVAFFGAMYFAALRPAEAATLRKANLSLPEEGCVSSSTGPRARRGSSPARPN